MPPQIFFFFSTAQKPACFYFFFFLKIMFEKISASFFLHGFSKDLIFRLCVCGNFLIDPFFQSIHHGFPLGLV